MYSGLWGVFICFCLLESFKTCYLMQNIFCSWRVLLVGNKEKQMQILFPCSQIQKESFVFLKWHLSVQTSKTYFGRIKGFLHSSLQWKVVPEALLHPIHILQVYFTVIQGLHDIYFQLERNSQTINHHLEHNTLSK